MISSKHLPSQKTASAALIANIPPESLKGILSKINENEKNEKKLAIANTKHIHNRLLHSLFISGVDTEEVTSVLNENVSVEGFVPMSNTNDPTLTKVNKNSERETDNDFWREVEFDAKGDSMNTRSHASTADNTISSSVKTPIKQVGSSQLPLILLKSNIESNTGNTSKSTASQVKGSKSNLSLPLVRQRTLDSEQAHSSTIDISGNDLKYFGANARSGFFDQYKRMRQERLRFSGKESDIIVHGSPIESVSASTTPSRSSKSFHMKPKFSSEISRYGKSNSSTKISRDLYQDADDDTISSFKHHYYGSAASNPLQRMTWAVCDRAGDNGSVHSELTGSKQSKQSTKILGSLMSSNLSLKSSFTDDNASLNSDLDSLSLASDYQEHNSLVSPRTKFLGFCIEEGLTPIPKMLLRKDLSTVMNMAHYGMGDKLGCVLAGCLDQVPAIATLNLEDNNLTDVSLEKFLACVERMPELTELNLSRNKIDDNASQGLATYLSNPACPLRKLILKSADVDDFECDRFVRAWATNRNLREVDLSENLLGSAENLNTVAGDIKTGGETIAEFISSKACQLESLNLAWNSIRLDSAVELTKAVAFNHTLTFLDLTLNGIGSKAGEILGESIQANKQLRTLMLGSNGLNGTACFCICVGVIENQSLKRLVLDNNPIGSGGAKAIMQVPMLIGGRVSLSAANCNTSIHDKNCWFDHNNPLGPYRDLGPGEYILSLDEPYERGIALSLLQIIASHQRLIFTSSAYEKGGRPSKLQLVQQMGDDAEHYFDSYQTSVIEGLRLLQRAAANWELGTKLFEEADADGSGELDKDELREVLERLGFRLDPERMSDIMNVFDIDGAGAIEKDEFITLMRSQYKEATMRIHDMTHYPMMALAATPTVRYVPPRVGVLRLKVADGFIRKKQHKTVSATDQKFAMEMAKNVGSASHLANAIKNIKLRFNEAYESYKLLNHETGSISKALAKVLPQLSHPSEARMLVSKATKDDRVKIAQLNLELGVSLKPIFGMFNGYYTLDLSKEVHRVCLGLLLEQSETLNTKRRDKMERMFGEGTIVGDTSFKANWSFFRNSFFNGEPYDINPTTFASIPQHGIVEFDFSGGTRPDGTEVPISDNRLVKVLSNLGLVSSADKPQAINQVMEWKAKMKQLQKMFGVSLCGCEVKRARQIGLKKDAFYGNLNLRRNQLKRAKKKEKIYTNFARDSTIVDVDIDSEDEGDLELGGGADTPATPATPATALATASTGGALTGEDRRDYKRMADDMSLDSIGGASGASVGSDTSGILTTTTTDGSLGILNLGVLGGGTSPLGTGRSGTGVDSTVEEVFLNAVESFEGMVVDDSHSAAPGLHQQMENQIKALKMRMLQLISSTSKGVSDYAKASRIADILEETFSKVWIRCRHLALIVRYFIYGTTKRTRHFGSYVADIVVCLFVRVVDIHNFELVMNEMNPTDAAAVTCRLGLLNIWNPCKPDGAIEVNMSIREERLVAKMLCHLSMVEPGVNFADYFFQWKRAMDNTPGFQVTEAWLTEKEMPHHGFFQVTYFSGDGVEKKGCKPDILTRKALTACVLVDENEMYGEDEMPPLTEVNSADIHLKTHKYKDVWAKYLFAPPEEDF